MNILSCKSGTKYIFTVAKTFIMESVLRVWDVYPGYEFFHPGFRMKEFKYF
jgi:hypothetical protein